MKPEHVEPIASRWFGSVGHFLFCSTASVYRTPTPVPHREDAPLETAPRSYGAEKAGAESVLLAAGRARRRPVTILRPQAVFGPGDARLPLHAWRRQLACEPVLIRPGTAGRRLNPLFVDDLVAFFFAAIGRPEASGRAFNAAGPEAVDPESFCALAGRAAGGEVRLQRLDPALAAELPHLGLPWPEHDLVADCGAIEAALGVRARPLSDALSETWETVRSSPRDLRLWRDRWERPARDGVRPNAFVRGVWAAYDRISGRK